MNARLNRRDAASGVTLIEVLVVLVVIAVASGAVMMGAGFATRDRSAEAEAQRLARLLELAVDEAVISQAAIALAWTAETYSFVPMDNARTLPGLLAEPHSLRAPLRLSADGSPKGQLVITASASGPSIVFTFQGAGPSERIAFDGFSTRYEGRDAP